MASGQKKVLLLKLLLAALLVIIIYLAVYPLYSNPERLKTFIEESTSYSPFIIILAIIVEVVIAPLPGFFIPLASGFLHGTLLGSLYAWIGNVTGSCIAFYLARRFGRPFVERIIKPVQLEKYDRFLTDYPYALWIGYIFPVFPVDIISFTVGLSDYKFRKFFLIVSVGFVPHLLLLSYFGKKLFLGEFMTIIIYSLLFALIVLLTFLLINIKHLKEVFKQLK
jgi:uncharacterized membrane protein YdjX (TVP38/TMEM64 family)